MRSVLLVWGVSVSALFIGASSAGAGLITLAVQGSALAQAQIETLDEDDLATEEPGAETGSVSASSQVPDLALAKAAAAFAYNVPNLTGSTAAMAAAASSSIFNATVNPAGDYFATAQALTFYAFTVETDDYYALNMTLSVGDAGVAGVILFDDSSLLSQDFRDTTGTVSRQRVFKFLAGLEYLLFVVVDASVYDFQETVVNPDASYSAAVSAYLEPTTIPEPGSLALCGVALVALVPALRRRLHQTA